ncbi:MAG: hypothetical protein LBO04_06210 [Spirochaetaceae bacterium]|jgi:hypothetical protein|nr:hypothetical protein [Spirochaetaceae bacterium]
MADKLDWLGKHLILLRCLTLNEAVDNENYKIRPDLAEAFVGVSGAEEMVYKFARLGDYKSACELLAYIAHRRAGIWWGYRCVVSLAEELLVNPAVDRDIAEIGASFDVKVPDFAKVEIPKTDPAQVEQLKAALEDSKAKLAEARAKVDPGMLKFVEDAVEVAFQEFKRVHGIHPKDLLKKLASRVGEDPYRIDRKSPLFVEAAKLKAQIQAARADAVDTIKAVIPPKVPAHEKKLRDNALGAVYRWVAAPDEVNSKACLDIGNECPDTPAGLLSLSAFWAFGNLMPGGEQVIPTPPGLAANGLNQTLLMSSLQKGGTRKVKERFELYFNLGIDVLSGKDNWEESLAANKPPHETLNPAPAPPANGKAPDEIREYKRWKPESERGGHENK